MAVVLVEVADVQTRLNRLQGLTLPKSVTPERITELIEPASGELLSKAGLTSAPADGSTSRVTLNGLCVELVVLRVKKDLFGNQPEMLRALLEDERGILNRAKDLAVEQPDSGVFLDVVGGA